jgi:hypothetical protein
MTAELEFFVGGVTTDMVEDVCRQILDDLADPHSPVHTKLSGLGLDGRRYDDLKIEERNHNLGTTIAIELLDQVMVFFDQIPEEVRGVTVERMLMALWQVLRRSLVERYNRSPGKRVK